MTDSVERFSNRVSNYAKYRPDYPREILPYLSKHCGLSINKVVADIGCGTGISSLLFLENGNTVIGVEPNDAMRNEAERLTAEFSNYSLTSGTCEATFLADASVDMVIAAQAFHWFDLEKARSEFQRILRPGGSIVIIWNERQLDSTPFLIEYEAFLLKYALDYDKVRHENTDAASLRRFFGRSFDSAVFPNEQTFDLDGLIGRMLSSSYMPSETHALFAVMVGHLAALFANHAENGKIKVFYDTNVYSSRY